MPPFRSSNSSELGIDVAIPCYRYGRYLRECVASVLGQEIANARVLIVDDASNDGSAEVAQQIAKEHSNVEVVVHASNRGHIATYNEGIGWARAKYFLLLSADDLVAPGAFKRAITMMESNPRVSFTHGAEIAIHPGDLIPDHVQTQASRWNVRPGLAFIDELCQSSRNPVGTSTVIVRTAAQKAVGGYRAELPHAGDFEMWLRLAAIGDVAEATFVQAFRRLHGRNMSVVQYGRRLDDRKQFLAAVDSFFSRYDGAEQEIVNRWPVARREFVRRLTCDALSHFVRVDRKQGLQLALMALRTDPHQAIVTVARKLMEFPTGPREQVKRS